MSSCKKSLQTLNALDEGLFGSGHKRLGKLGLGKCTCNSHCNPSGLLFPGLPALVHA